MKSSGDILHERVLEVRSDSLGISLAEGHLLIDCGMQAGLGANRNSGRDCMLEVRVEPLGGIVLTRLPTHKASRIEELLPHRWQPAPV